MIASGRPQASVEIPGCRGAIVGPKGRGKTTLLEELDSALRKRGYSVRLMRLAENRPHFHGPPARTGEMILLDGAEQLRNLQWTAFRWEMRRARAVVVTTHSEGRLPTLYRCETTPALLVSLASKLLSSDAGLDNEHMFELFERLGGDIRQALRELYDFWRQASNLPKHNGCVNELRANSGFSVLRKRIVQVTETIFRACGPPFHEGGFDFSIEGGELASALYS